MTTGKLISLNISPGGVPKLPVPSADLLIEGFVGDGHDDKKHHGGPDRAVCIYAMELIEKLRSEGHPIFPGSAGENLTVSGIDWSEMVPGIRLRVGQALVEVTSFTSPCKTIRESFVNGRFQRISQISNPGWSRVYSKVLTTGLVECGDLVGIVRR